MYVVQIHTIYSDSIWSSFLQDFLLLFHSTYYHHTTPWSKHLGGFWHQKSVLHSLSLPVIPIFPLGSNTSSFLTFVDVGDDTHVLCPASHNTKLLTNNFHSRYGSQIGLWSTLSTNSILLDTLIGSEMNLRLEVSSIKSSNVTL